MAIKEIIVGYDVRCATPEDEDCLKIVQAEWPHIVYPKVFDNTLWPSVFRLPSDSEYPADPLQTNFRDPQYPSADGKFLVYDHFSFNYQYNELWDNLGSMLCCRPPQGHESVVAISLISFSDPPIFCFGDVNYPGKTNIFQSSYWEMFCAPYLLDNIIPAVIDKSQWNFRGYDITMGLTTLLSGQFFLSKIGEIYKVNEFGLVEDIQHAITNCKLLNEIDKDHGAYLIFGIYEAKHNNTLDLI